MHNKYTIHIGPSFHVFKIIKSFFSLSHFIRKLIILSHLTIRYLGDYFFFINTANLDK